MAKRDGKDRFFASLNLDKKTKKLIQTYRKLKEQIEKETK